MSSLPVSRRQALVAAVALLALLAVAGRTLAGAGASAPVAQTGLVPEPAGAAPRIVVHVTGAVARPGLYRLKEGSRVADAVARAGGATGKADTAAVNLAAPLADGIQVLMPSRVAGGAGAAAAAGGSGAGGAGSGVPISLSSATIAELDTLPGVGPVTAQKIVDHRAAHGAFSSVDDLDAIPGIGPARLGQLRGLVTP
ncbi:MAG: helix-hairpin-helix domain-containing protein [Actinobacteria bacterium]|nr:helix-hairpin-helix domain-containing protein [Actinomycetota bacterium]